MRENDTNRKSKFGSWSDSNPRHIAEELKSRKLYNETRGTKFESDTRIVKQTESRASRAAPEPVRGSQGSMGLFGNSSRRSSGGSNFFEKLMRDAQSNNGSAPQAGKPNTSSWMKGMSSNVPQDKRGALERQLKWMATLEAGASPQQAPTQQMHFQQPPGQQPAQQMMPVQPAPAQAMPPMGEVFGMIAAAPQSAPPTDTGALRAALAQPANRELFTNIRNRIATLLLHELPPDVTADLRQIARELEQLNGQLGQSS
jgi:hypothetical protein